MNDKILNALGEELSEQVKAKIEEAGIELGIVNDGTLVPADKHDSLKKEHKSLQEKYEGDINNLNTKLEELSGKENSVEELKLELQKVQEQAQNNVQDLQGKLQQTRKESEFEKALFKKDVSERYIPLFKKTTDWEKLEITDEGVNGVEELVNSYNETYPEAFGEVKKVGTPPSPNLDNPVKTGKAKLIEKYNQVEKDPTLKAFDKGVKLREIDKQIKSLKE